MVEDDAFTRLTVTTLIRSLGHSVVASADSVLTAMDAARQGSPTVAVIDLDLGAGPTGLDLSQGLRRLRPDLGIVILSSYADARVLGSRSRPLPPRAQFLSKRNLGEAAALDEAIRSSRAGAEGASTAAPSAAWDITDAQFELMRLVASGFSNDEIANRMHVTEAGVRRAITRLLRKLNIEASSANNPRVLLARAYVELAGQPARDC